VPTADESARDRGEDQQLIRGLRQALRSEHPLDLLEAVSGLLTVTDPRTRNPFEPDDETLVGLAELVESFVETDYAETTAALTVIRAFTADELLASRVKAVLAGRRQPMPSWLGGLDEVAITRVMTLTHILGDGDDYFLEARLPSGEAFTALVYVDHNLGTVVKDAFVIPEELDSVTAIFERTRTDPDQLLADVDPAVARAIMTEAIDHGARMFPPLESDSWPGCRPLVEWLLRKLPAGGALPERPDWSDDELAALRADFFASPYGQDLDRPDERSLLETLTWFGTDWGPGDPLRWSPVNVEMLLADWIPRKIVADPAYLAKAPDLLRAFIRYCHDRRGIRRDLTQQTLAAVDHWEPDYQQVIRSSRPQGPEALLAGLLDGRSEDFSLEAIMLESLERAVGGRWPLMHLDDAPLPDEPFEWAGIPADVHERVREVLELCDRCASQLLDVEHRTAIRRFLGRAVVGDPSIFRRKGSPARAAAAVCWAICKANHTIWPTGALEAQELIGWFGVKGAVSQRAEVFLRAVGVDPYGQYGSMDLGTPDFLVGARRRHLIELRDRYLARES